VVFFHNIKLGWGNIFQKATTFSGHFLSSK